MGSTPRTVAVMPLPARRPAHIRVVMAPTTFPQPVRCWVDDDQVFSHETSERVVEVTPGRREVTCEAQGQGGFGEKSTLVDVGPGQTVTVHYAVPLTHISQGAIGPAPPARRAAVDARQVALSVGGAVLMICLCGAGRLLWERLLV